MIIFAAGLDFRFTPEGGHADAPGSKKRDGVAFGLANSFGQAYTSSITGREYADKPSGHRWLRDDCAPAYVLRREAL